MLTITLEPNRSTPRRFVAKLTYERVGDKVTPMRRVFIGPTNCASATIMPWPVKYWSAEMRRDLAELHYRLETDRSKP